MLNTDLRVVRLRKDTYERAAKAAKAAGYSSPEELIEHVLEQALDRMAIPDSAAPGATADDVEKRLRGLGYI